MINGDNEGLMVQENVRIPYDVKNILPNKVKKCLTFAVNPSYSIQWTGMA